MKEDHILIEQLNASSIEAFSALYDKYAGMVFNFTHAILKDTYLYLSEDITQSCFALMWIRRTSISPDGNVPAWLYVVARNAVFKELRRQVTASKYIDYVSNSDGVRQEEFETGDTAAILAEAEAAIAALPESRRMIYKMRFIEGLSVHEISERLDISPKTVETQIARAKNAIRQRISELLMLAVILS